MRKREVSTASQLPVFSYLMVSAMLGGPPKRPPLRDSAAPEPQQECGEARAVPGLPEGEMGG